MMSIHPSKQEYILYRLQALYNFAFYGFKSVFILIFMELGELDQNQTILLFSTFMSLLYGSPIVGGILADKFIGAKNAIICGGLLCFFGSLFFIFESSYVFFLPLLSLGSGLLQPSLSSSVGRTEQKVQSYSLLYMAISIGEFLGPIFFGFLLFWGGCFYGGCALCLIFFLMTVLSRTGILFEKPLVFSKMVFASIIMMAMLLGMYFILKNLASIHGVMGSILLGGLLLFFIIYNKCTKTEQIDLQKMVFWLLCYTFIFACLVQSLSSITLFIEHTVDRQFMGLTIPSSVFLSLNPLYVLILSPLFCSKKYTDKDTTWKIPRIALGFLFISLSFLLFGLSLCFGDAVNTKISPCWVIAAFGLQAMGGVCIVPIGFSIISRLSPHQFRSVMMGFWLMTIAYAYYLGGLIAKLYTIESVALGASLHEQNPKFFFYLSTTSLIGGAFIYGARRFLWPPIER